MSDPLRAFVVDDEPAAVRRLARLLKATGGVVVVGTETDPVLALGEIPERDVDALFLDIKMPGMDGFELLERLPANPLVVFVTGHDEFALRAFETQAVDYLMKPVSRERLDGTLAKLERLRGDPKREHLNVLLERLASYGLLRRRQPYADHVRIELGSQRMQVIEVSRVSHFVARGKATYAVIDADEYLVQSALADLERRLDPKHFVRIHRGTLLNLAWVDTVEVSPVSGLTVRLKGGKGTELEVSRGRARALKERMIL